MLAVLLLGVAHATDIGTVRTLGVGPALGTATGGSVKIYLGGRATALDVAFGAANGTGVLDAVFGHVSVHRHFRLASGDGVDVPWRIGLGGFVSTRDAALDDGATGFGLRVPVGVDLDWARTPIQVGLEVSPATVTLVPVPRFGLDASLVVRYYL